MCPCRAGLIDFRFGGRWRLRAYRREALDELRTMGRSVHACRVPELRAIRDAALAPVVVFRLYAPYPRLARARVRCSLCVLRVCMCVYDTYAEDLSKVQTHTSEPQDLNSISYARAVCFRLSDQRFRRTTNVTWRGQICPTKQLRRPGPGGRAATQIFAPTPTAGRSANRRAE
jgi:hypothetical protein